MLKRQALLPKEVSLSDFCTTHLSPLQSATGLLPALDHLKLSLWKFKLAPGHHKRCWGHALSQRCLVLSFSAFLFSYSRLLYSPILLLLDSLKAHPANESKSQPVSPTFISSAHTACTPGIILLSKEKPHNTLLIHEPLLLWFQWRDYFIV